MVSVDYFVLDLETANPDYASICQIGLVEVKAGIVVAETSLLLDPDDYIDPFNVRIHGITRERVGGSPHFDLIAPALATRLSHAIVVHHGPFDKIALNRACEKYNLAAISANWLQSESSKARVARVCAVGLLACQSCGAFRTDLPASRRIGRCQSYNGNFPACVGRNANVAGPMGRLFSGSDRRNDLSSPGRRSRQAIFRRHYCLHWRNSNSATRGGGRRASYGIRCPIYGQ
jgi:hypothetical protein